MTAKPSKIGFWALTALVTGNLVGSGVFLLPSTLAPFGMTSLLGWIATTFGAIILSLIFGQLSCKHTRTGGPFVYVEDAFGRTPGFFVAWGYWVLSWISNAALVVAAVGYFSKMVGEISLPATLALEIFIMVAFTAINLRGIAFSGAFEIFITLFKVVPLVLIPVFGIFYMDLGHFTPINPTEHSLFGAINTVALITIWGYIGLETGTVPSGEVESPRKTVPKAVVTGTLIAALVYILGTVAIMGVVPKDILVGSGAPYADLAAHIFGGNWHHAVSFMAIISCLGALNGWILVVGQIGYGAGKDNLFPKLFEKTTASGSPKWALILSSACSIPFMVMTLNKNLVNQFNFIVDVSVTLVMVIYALCVAAYVKFLIQQDRVKTKYWVLAGIGGLFTFWAMWVASLKMILLSCTIFVVGIPVYWFQRRKWLVLK